MSVKQVVTIVLFSLLLTSASGQTNRALLIAIDKYPEESGWNDIHATNDQQIVLPMLRSVGFENAHIVCLLNEKATKRGILKALADLLRQSRRGDYIYLHFSCHGQLMADNNGDEPDGYDESLIPYDAGRRYIKGVYEGANHFRDDELGWFLDKIRARIGADGSVCVVLDACHSGTANRDGDDETYIRGTTYIFAPENYIPITGKDKNTLKLSDSLAPISIWSACQADQNNYEYRHPKTGKYFGSLSFAFCEVIQTSYLEKITIAALNKRITAYIETTYKGRRYKQTPYFETTNENKVFKIGR